MGPNPNGPLSEALEILDTQVFSGSVKRGSDRWRFLGIKGNQWFLDIFCIDPGNIKMVIPFCCWIDDFKNQSFLLGGSLRSHLDP